ncbi:hypothetical protein C2845_PM08G16040 [Panicum miliaceum]|uniref:Uncharacterized protein n=1 Tax=Panicum miliaceum TaxID=4540 RepID=A0A3L6R312_PANMI|nr:hypothetical protein C2845_PM08G16040 [Panicum miliaceum]
MKGPVEITLTRDIPSNRRCWWRRDDDLLDDGDVGVLRIGRGLAAVETTFSDSDEVTKRWLAEASAAARGRRLRAPLVAGLVALRGRDPADQDRCWRKRRTGFRPNDHGNPIRCLALCLGGSRALVYSPEALGYRVGKPAYAADQLDFYCNNMNQLRAFLDDNRITVACTYWLGKAALKREKAKAQRVEYDTDEEERLNNLGRTWRPPKVVRGLSLERMARVALGPEVRLARCPAKVAQADWGSYYLGEEEWAYATRDAYLCFEIAAAASRSSATPSASSYRRAPSQLLRRLFCCCV